MFCPTCGAQVAEGSGFCRGCGADLKLVAQALAREAPLVIAQKIDAAIKNSPTVQLDWLRDRRYRAWGELLTGAASLFVLVWFLILRKGNPEFAYGALAAFAAYAMLLGAWDLRRLFASRQVAGEPDRGGLRAGEHPRGLSPADTSEIIPAASVTENTTRNLRQPVRRD